MEPTDPDEGYFSGLLKLCNDLDLDSIDDKLIFCAFHIGDLSADYLFWRRAAGHSEPNYFREDLIGAKNVLNALLDLDARQEILLLNCGLTCFAARSAALILTKVGACA